MSFISSRTSNHHLETTVAQNAVIRTIYISLPISDSMKFQNELFLSLVHINKSQVILDVNSYGYVCDTVT